MHLSAEQKIQSGKFVCSFYKNKPNAISDAQEQLATCKPVTCNSPKATNNYVRMKNLLTLIILLLPALYSRADEENTVKKTTDAHITGHIILKETGEHLPFMTILLKGTNIGTATDETGHFFLKNLPVGKYTLRVQGVGYKSVEKEVLITKGKTQEINFEVSEDAVMLDGAVVTANRNETDRREAPVIVNVLSPKGF